MQKLINYLTPDYKNLKNKVVFAVLLSISFFIRFPFFFRDYIDRDESTFILMGQSWVDGFLPYTELWDLKPPITFLFFAGVIAIFGKSFIAIRFAGTILVALTAFFTYKIGETVNSKKVGFWAAVACVALQSMFGSIQGVMSEHLCIALFMPGLYILIKLRNASTYFTAGLLMGLSIMVKLNIAYTILFIGLYLFYLNAVKKKYAKAVWSTILYGLGISSIVLLTALPYYIEGDITVWWKSVVLASLEYAGARRSSIASLAPTFILLGAFFFFIWKKKYIDFKKIEVQILMITIAGVLLSFFKAGRINSHYLIQLYPILIVIIAIFISKVPVFRNSLINPYLFLLLLLVPAESYLEYYAIVKNKIEKGTFYNGEGITAANYIKKNNLETENIFFLEYHIGYWSLDAKPPTMSSTHPSNICRSELFPYFNNPRKTAIQEIKYIMNDIRPKIVVTRKDRLIFSEEMEQENNYVSSYLRKHYKVLTTVEQAEIHQRLE